MRMSTPKHKSGYQERNAKEKERKMLSKEPKLNLFFKEK
jgi:hypothetical protein